MQTNRSRICKSDVWDDGGKKHKGAVIVKEKFNAVAEWYVLLSLSYVD